VFRVLASSRFLLLLTAVVVAASVYADWGQSNWLWFQRSGSVIALVGAVLGFRSIVRLGKAGVGGANPVFLRGTVKSVDGSGPVQRVRLAYDDETKETLRQSTLDRDAGAIGAILLLLGTVVWGYGDLLGRVL
jgi:hypothetical protein